MTDFSFLSSPFFILALLVDLILKGIALWKSARHDQLLWFIAILLISSIGILPMIYLLAFQKPAENQS
jgi:hypothetical protein